MQKDNYLRHEKLLDELFELLTDGHGEIEFAGKMVTASQDGIVSLDDACLYLAAYYNFKGIPEERRRPVDLIKLKVFIKLGLRTNIDGVSVYHRVADIHDELKWRGIRRKDKYTALVDVAVRQNASQTKLSDDEIAAIIMNPYKRIRSVEEIQAIIAHISDEEIKATVTKYLSI